MNKMHKRIKIILKHEWRINPEHKSRYHNLDEMTRAFAARRGRCAVVSLGAGLETAAFRLADLEATFYEVDLPEVIAARRSLLPPTPREALVGADVLGRDWMDRLEPTTDRKSVV